MKKKELADLLIQAVQHLRVNALCAIELGKQDYDFYKNTEKFLNKKSIKKLDIYETAYEDLILELIKE